MNGLTEALIALRVCLAIFFVTGAVGKLVHHRDFVRGTIDYQILPAGASRAVAFLLPWVELAVGLMLLAGVALPVAGAAAATMLVAFTAAVAVNLGRGRRIACNCYGIAATSSISPGTVARNGLLVAMAAAVAGLGVAIAAPPDAWLVRQWIDLAPLDSASSLLVVVIDLAWCLAIVHLVEWTLDIHVRVSELKADLGG